jgi:hypothetical protein
VPNGDGNCGHPAHQKTRRGRFNVSLKAIHFLAIAVALISPGCSTNSASSPSDSKVSDAKEKLQEAADATTAAAKARRDEYVRELQRKLDEIDVKYKALEDRAAEAKGDAKKDLDEKVKVAKAKRDAAARKLDELKEAGVDRWEKIKEGVGSALDDLKKVIE